MRRFLTITILIVCFAAGAAGQTFTDQLRRPNYKDVKVTVTQSKEIEDLVNGPKEAPAPAVTTTKKADTTAPAQANAATTEKKAGESENKETKETKETKPAEPRTEKPALAKEKEKNSEETEETPAASDNHKKMMRGGRKITGYRVQAFAGGNKRSDREAAERAGKKIKNMYPDEAIFVHFYSPRWICRVGNYRTMEEARQMLRKVKKLGFSQACIIKAKITVAY